MTDAVHVPSSPSVRAEDYKVIYSNTTKTGLGPWDITLIFCQGKLTEQGTMVIEEQVAVVMSPQLFKTLVVATQDAMAAYEANFGKVEVRPDLILRPPSESIKESIASAVQRIASPPSGSKTE